MKPSPIRPSTRPNGERSPAAIVTALALLLSASIATVVMAKVEGDAVFWVSHTRQVQETNLKLFSVFQDVALAERGYLITQDRRYIDRYRAADAQIPSLERRLEQATRDNPDQQRRLGLLDRLIAEKLDQLDSAIALRQAGRSDDVAAAVRADLSIDASQTVRAVSEAVDAEENRLLDRRQATLALYQQLLFATIAASIIAWFVLAGFVRRADRESFTSLHEQNLALTAEIARRESVEAQLRQAQKMEAVGQLTGGIAHDFNNVLQIIIANLDALGRRMDGPGDRAKVHVDQALEGAHRAASLTRSLLAFSRQQPLEPKAVDVNRVVADMSRLLRGALGEAVTIETVQSGGLWPAFVDRAQFENALLNLAVNARDAMPGGGKLTIETANAYLDDAYAAADGTVAAGQYVLVALTDTGAGMSEEVLSKVFDPFFTTKGPGAGTGLGLSQVHGFIKQSGGHVKLYTEPGVGTTVKLYLPRARSDHQVDAPTVPAAWSTPPSTSGLLVLVVEDDVLVRTATAEALRDLGHEVLEAGGVEEALGLMDSHPAIRLVLTDVVMPGASGRVLADALRQRRPDLPVVFMTGYTRNAIVHNGVVDADALLITKPFTAAQLAAKIHEALAQAAVRDP